MGYVKQWLDTGKTDFELIETYPDGREVVVSKTQDVFQTWQGTPTERDFLTPVVKDPVPLTIEMVQRIRQSRYETETDPLLLGIVGYQAELDLLAADSPNRDAIEDKRIALLTEWKTKKDAIREQYPYPEE